MRRGTRTGRTEHPNSAEPVAVPLPEAASGKPVVLVADSQGCADAGVCYPATRQKLTLTLPQPGQGPGPVVEATPRKKNWFN